jgi:hypothetical protein
MSGKTASLRFHGLLALALLSVSLPALAQSLGEAARREQEKKGAKRAPAARTYGDEDLKVGRRPGPAPGPSAARSPSPDASPSPSPSPISPSPEPDRAALERQWRTRFADVRARIAEADARAWEDRIEVVFVSGIPVQQRVRVKVDTPELRAARQALEDLEEELRRAGLPPGWGRE